mgnify:CR=1 FL=1
MAILSNINDQFRVDSAGAIYFGTSAGTNGQILKSVGTGGSPVWIDQTDITGPFVLKAGDTMTGNLAINGSNSLTVGGTISGGSSITGVSIIGTSRVQSDDNMMMVAGQFYIGASTGSVDDTYRFYTASGVYYLQSRKSGTWTSYLEIASDGDATFYGSVTAPSFSGSHMQNPLKITSTYSSGNNDILFSGGTTTGTASNTTARIRNVATAPGGAATGNLIFTVNSGDTFVDALTLSNAGNATFAGQITASKNQNATSSFTFQNTDTTGTSVRTHLNATAGNRSIRLEAIHSDYSYVVSNNARMYFQTNSGSNNTLFLDGNNATFAGDLTMSSGAINSKNLLFSGATLPAANTPSINLRDSNNEFYFQSGSAHIFNFIRYDNRNSMMNIESTGILVSGGGTFSGNVTISQPTNGAEAKLILTSKSAAGNSRTGIVEYDADTEKIFFINESTTVAAMTSGGNVGIGTDSPGGKLHISDTSTQLILETPNTTNDIDFRFRENGTNKWNMRYQNSTNDLQFLNQTGTAFVQLELSANGNVGIGTDSPDSLLVVQADTHNEAFVGKRSATEYLWFLRNENNSGRFQLYNSSSNHTIEMTAANGRINQAQMIAGTAFALSNGGFATFGSTSGSVPIAIAIDGDASTASIVVPTNKNVCIGGVYNYTGTGVTSLNINGGDYPLLAFYGDTNLRTTIIAYSNNTLFSHPLSSAKWQFENGTGIMGELSGSGTLTVKGDVVAYGSPSDISLKENIKPISNSLDKVKKLQGVTFDWIQKKDQILDIKEDYGFIAQDVKKIVPELVRKNEDGLLSMRHQGIIPMLVEAIKELEARVKELENR